MPNVSLSGIEFEIRGKTDSASKSIETLTKRLEELNGALQNTASIKVLASGIKKLSTAVESLSKMNVTGTVTSLKAIGEVLKSMEGLENIAKSMGAFGNGIAKLAKNSDKLPDVAVWLSKISEIDFSGQSLGAISDAAKNVGAFARAMAKLSESPDKLATITEWLKQIAAIDFSNLERASNAIRSITLSAKQMTKNSKSKFSLKDYISNMASDIVGKLPKAVTVIKAVASGLGKLTNVALKVGVALGKGLGALVGYPLKAGTKNVLGFTKSIKGVIGGFKRIVGYRIIRSIIREITQGFQEGVKNLYEWSRLTGGAMGSRNKTFAQSLDQIATSLLYFKNSIGAAVAPIINALAPAIDFLIDKIVTLINVLNQLFAKLTGATSWTRAKKKATEYGDAVSGAGQAAEEALRYLAPFDELNVLPDQKDNGSGGGGGGTDYSDMFEDVTEFNEAIANFADMIREKINAGDWQGLGELLGNKVNEIVDSIDFAGLGVKVGTGINAWFTTKYWTLETINFQNIGAKIAEFLNNALAQIDFNTVGRTLTQKFTIIGDLLIGALENVNWSLVGKSIGDYIRGAFDQVSEWLQGIDWNTVGAEFYNALKNTLIGIDFSSVAQSVFTFLGSALGAASSFIVGAIQQAWADIKAYFLQFIPDDASWAEAGLGVLKGIASAFVGLFQWVYNNIYTPFVNSFKSVFGISSGNATQMEGSGEKIGWGIIDGIVKPFANPVGWILEKIVNKIKSGLEEAWDGTTIDENGYSGLSGKMSIDADITSVTDSVPKEDKVSKDWGIDIVLGTDKIPPAKKSSSSWTAQMNLAKDNIPADQKKVTTVANMTSRSVVKAVTDPIVVTANMNSRTFSGNTANPVDLTANMKKRTLGDKVKKPVTVIANMTKRTLGEKVNRDVTVAAYMSKRILAAGVNADINVTAKATSLNDSIPSYQKEITVTATANGLHVRGGTIMEAGGGVYEGGQWHDIARYGTGGLARGSQLFWARETGSPELVGTLGGHTAVMNNDQIVSSVSAGVARAISGIRFKMTGLGNAPTQEGGMDEESIYRAMLRALNDSDVFPDEIDLDGAVVYRKMVQRNRLERNRTGVNPMMAS